MNETVQSKFLKKIEEVIPSHTSMVSELSDTLEVSQDSAYRRLRGETKLNIEEMVILCNKYNISLDSFIQFNASSVSFQYRLLTEGSESFKQHLLDLKRDLLTIKSFENPHIYYACEDIPIFHNLSSPEIASFKMFYWMKSILNAPEFEDERFDFDLIKPELIILAEELWNLYSEIPSSEIWTDTTIQSTVKQIKYYWASGMFKTNEDALKVCHSLKTKIEQIQKLTENKSKSSKHFNSDEFENNYNFYVSDLEITNNTVLVNLGETSRVYIGHLTFNTMATGNAKYCTETQSWLNNLISKSTLISGVSEKYRYQFFKKSMKYIDELIQAIEND